MTRVDFHVVAPGRRGGAEHAACALAADLFAAGRRVYIHTGDEAASARLDDLLWTFQDTSFVPHARAGAAAQDAPILIGDAEPPPDTGDALINLRDEVPACFSRFEQVLEIVPADDAGKAAARVRWRHYKERGYPLTTRDLA